MAIAGCSHARDSYDKAVIEQVKKGLGTFGTNGIIDTPADAGSWPKLKSKKPRKDSDGDGMPDRWEKRHGLNRHDPSDASAYTISQEYTNIECYLNSLVGKNFSTK